MNGDVIHTLKLQHTKKKREEKKVLADLNPYITLCKKEKGKKRNSLVRTHAFIISYT